MADNTAKINVSTLTTAQRQLRANIRAFFLAATVAEMEAALPNYRDEFSQRCIREMIAEDTPPADPATAPGVSDLPKPGVYWTRGS